MSIQDQIDGETERWNFVQEFKPTLWQRIRWWDRWPWRPVAVEPARRSWDANWVTVIRQGVTIIGWHLDEDRPAGVHVWPGRWACFYGLITGRLRFDVEINPGAPQRSGDLAATPAEETPRG